MAVTGWRATAWGLAAVAGVLAGCAGAPVVSGAEPVALPQLALSPAALGCSLAVQQQLTVQPPGGAAQSLDALLEVDAQTVRLALFHLGQRMGVLSWDGKALQTQLSPWWPRQLPAAQVLGDMQLALWPMQAIAQSLPAGWQLMAGPQGRSLAYEGQVRVAVQAEGMDAFAIRYLPVAWSLHVASPGGMSPCAAGQEAP